MKSKIKPLVLLAALAGLTFSIPALSDQTQADCVVYEHGDRKPAQSGSCMFSQRQGYIDISLKSGLSFSLSPQGAPDTFADQNGVQVKRIEADGNLHKYKWKHRLIIVNFNGMPAEDAGQGENTSSNGPAEWDRGCEDAKGGSYDRSGHSDAYEEGWQACNK